MARAEAARLQRQPAGLVRGALPDPDAGRRHPLARRAAGRARPRRSGLGGMVVGLPARRPHPRAAGGGGRPRAPDLPARRRDRRPAPCRRSGIVAQRRYRQPVPQREGQRRGSRCRLPPSSRGTSAHLSLRRYPAVYARSASRRPCRRERGPAAARTRSGGRASSRTGERSTVPFSRCGRARTIDEILSALHLRLLETPERSSAAPPPTESEGGA